MKRTKASWIYFVLQIVFMVIVPCIFIWVQYGDLTKKYKISVTAILLLILIFLVFKKIVLDKWIKTFDIKISNIETNALSITDKQSIEANKKTWRALSIVQLFFNSIIPILLFVLAIITINVVEQGLIKLYGCLMFCLFSITLGVVFKFGEILSMKLYHE